MLHIVIKSFNFAIKSIKIIKIEIYKEDGHLVMHNSCTTPKKKKNPNWKRDMLKKIRIFNEMHSESRYHHLRWLQVPPQSNDIISRGPFGFSSKQQVVAAVDLEELTLLLGSTSHHGT